MAGKNQQFWTEQNIVLSILALHDAGVPLHSYRLMRDRSEITSNILLDIVGRRTTGSGLYVVCRKKFGSLDKAFREAGLQPCEVRGDTSTWTKAQLVRSIQALYGNNIPLNVAKIENDRTEKSLKIIYEASKLRITARKLYRIASKKFGSWDKAIKAAGLSISKIKRNHKRWSRRYIISSIRKIDKKGISLNFKNIEKDKGRVISKLIAPDKRKISYSIKLINSAKKEFGSWDLALNAAGFDVEKISKRPKFWTREMMVNSIIALDKIGVPLNANRIQFDATKRTTDAITDVVGHKITGAQLYGAVSNHYGAWTHVLEAVRKNPNKVGKNISFWTKRSVVRSIRELHRSKVALNPSAIRFDRTDKTKIILKNTYEGKASGPILYSAATSLFSSWEVALIEATLNPAEIRKKGMPVSRSGQNIKNLIFFLNDSGFKLNATNVYERSKNVKFLTCDAFRKVISGQSILNEARKSEGDWESALRQAGLDPNKIVLRSKSKWTFSTTPHQIERFIGADGSVYKQAVMGNPVRNPEEMMEEEEISSSIKSVLQSLFPNGESLYQDLLGAISSVETFNDQDDFAQKVSNCSGGKLDTQKILHILRSLKNRKELQS